MSIEWYLKKDGAGHVIQGFVADPSKSVAPFALSSSSKVLRFSGTLQAGELDFTGRVSVKITPSSNNLTRYYNGDTTKTTTIFGGTENVILVHSSVQTITISGTDTSIEVEGM